MAISITGTGNIQGASMQLVQKVSWTTNTASVSLTFDNTKYDTYFLFYWIDHNPNWYITAARFRNSSGDLSSSYAFNTEWLSTSSASGTNTASFNAATGWETGGSGKTACWLSGNGTGYDSHGFCQISCPNDSTAYPWIRANSTLIYRDSTDTYNEKGGGSHYGTAANTITGITLYGTGGVSRRGSVSLIGIKRNPFA